MREYRLLTYYSVTGLREHIELSDFSYGEWVVYDSGKPSYHVCLFDERSASNAILKSMLSGTENIGYIISKINAKYGTKLSLNSMSVTSIIKESKIVKLDLPALPERWLKNI